MPRLSKSKLLAFRQCPKRLWLEIHHPEHRHDSAATEASFETGHEVGEAARRIYDPDNTGVLLDARADGYEATLARTREALEGNAPIFEAGFAIADAVAFADVMLPTGEAPPRSWRMIEVKSSTGVKDYHRDDASIQSFIARAAGAPLAAIAVAHIDSGWIYPGGGDYAGLLVEEDVTDEALARADEVATWLSDAKSVMAAPAEPKITTGAHCSQPFPCGFQAYCQSREPQADFPVAWLPRLQSNEVKSFIETKSITDLRDVPDDYLNDVQRRVKAHTISGRPFFDATAAAAELAKHALPACFLDFEAVQFAVPIWAGTRPYQQIPFQFSLHRMTTSGDVEHTGFLDLTGEDPSLPFADALIRACGSEGPVFAYNAAYEAARMRELADRFPQHGPALHAIVARLVDLLPIARRHFYHPSQQGSWSIKSVLPAVAPDLDYEALDGVKDGGMAMLAYREAIDRATSAARREEIRRQLTDYCRLDTYALVRVWQHFSGRSAR